MKRQLYKTKRNTPTLMDKIPFKNKPAKYTNIALQLIVKHECVCKSGTNEVIGFGGN